MTVIDISRPLSPATAVWPGDRPPAFSWTMQQSDGASVNVGAAHISLHSGSHVDAPRHYTPDGPTVDQLPLEPFLGPACVVDVGDVDSIRPDHVANGLGAGAPRVLFKTDYSHVPATDWTGAFASVAPETIRWLAERDVVLVGTDTPSFDPPDSQELPAHHALNECAIMNLEHLDLSGVAPGRYQLVALPLRLEGMDASPVRAVLIQES